MPLPSPGPPCLGLSLCHWPANGSGLTHQYLCTSVLPSVSNTDKLFVSPRLIAFVKHLVLREWHICFLKGLCTLIRDLNPSSKLVARMWRPSRVFHFIKELVRLSRKQIPRKGAGQAGSHLVYFYAGLCPPTIKCLYISHKIRQT